jgi:hypothetical protein
MRAVPLDLDPPYPFSALYYFLPIHTVSRGCNNIVGSAVLTNLQSGGAVLRHARVLRLWAGWCRPSLGGYYGSAKGEQLCCRPGTAVKLLRPAVQVNPAQPEETNCD